MEIKGGSATGNSVTLHSKDFIATARFHKKTGVITSEVRRSNMLNRFLVRHPYLPPRTIASLLETLSKMSKKVFLILSTIMIAVVVIFSIILVYFGIENAEQTNGKIESFVYGARPLLLLVALVFYRAKVAGFHGAEHMAKSAYEQFGKNGIERLMEGDRYNPDCLCRYLAPAILVSIFTFFGLIFIGEAILIFSALLFESLLWLDKIIGINNFRPIEQVTKFVQANVTTKPPNKNELRTAQVALRQLLLAHKVF